MGRGKTVATDIEKWHLDLFSGFEVLLHTLVLFFSLPQLCTKRGLFTRLLVSDITKVELKLDVET